MTTTEEIAAPAAWFPLITNLGVSPGAYRPADWHDVPKGHYAIPVRDWTQYSDDIGTEHEGEPAALLGFQFVERKCARVFRNGRTQGKDELTAGTLKLTPVPARFPAAESWQRLRDEIRADRFQCEHDYRRQGDPEPPCRCMPGCWPDGNRDGTWKAVPGQREAYNRHLAAVILDGIANHGDVHRKLYGLLTGNCGRCGRTLTDPDSKMAGIGPECRRTL